jgi:hypothetical protein
MDIYLSSLLLGGVGLGTMALGGLGRHGHSSHSHSSHSNSGPGHSGHVTHGHAISHSHSHTPAAAVAHGHGHHTGAPGIHAPPTKGLWLLSWPRLAFGFLLGAGATGLALQPVLPELFTAAAAVTGGIGFQTLIIRPLWNFFLRFASTPALTSESAYEATAVTAFNASGEGLVALEVDGQVLQVLGRLTSADRSLGVTVRAGQRLRVDDVNTGNNCCTVSAL